MYSRNVSKINIKKQSATNLYKLCHPLTTVTLFLNPSYLCNKINCLSFTAFTNFELELMKTFQFIQIKFISQRMQIHIEKKKKRNSYKCSVNDSPWIKITKITIIVVFALISSLVFARKAFGNVKTSNFVSKNLARITNFMS